MAEFFAGTRPGRIVALGEMTFELPVLYYRDDSFFLFFTAELDKVKAILPSDRLHPVTLMPGKAVLAIGAFNYIESTAGPYGEVGVAIPVVHGPKPPPPLLPALMESRYPGFGLLIMHLPVTTMLSRDGGRAEWGYTKFLADMDFLITPEYMECRLAEGGRKILTQKVARQGLTFREHRALVTYSVRDGDLVKTRIPQLATCRFTLRPKGSSLTLGEHPVADSIRALGISGRPFMSRYYEDRTAYLPAGEVIERGVRPFDGYLEKDVEGRLTVSYWGQPPATASEAEETAAGDLRRAG